MTPADKAATKLALAGRRVLVTSGGRAGARLAAEVSARGGEPIQRPLIETAPPEDPAALAAAIADWNAGRYDWLAVTSANGAAAVADADPAARPDAGRFAAVGPATADALRECGLGAGHAPVLVPEREFTAAGLARAMLAELGGVPQRVLLPLSAIAGDTLEAALRGAGHEVTRVDGYRTLPAADGTENVALAADVAAGRIDAILITSRSIAREVARRFAPLPEGTALAAIGESSARALEGLGLAADITARVHTAGGLIDALEGHYR